MIIKLPAKVFLGQRHKISILIEAARSEDLIISHFVKTFPKDQCEYFKILSKSEIGESMII